MSFFIGILTFLLIINCLMLILLVLVQLPKKDAGAGIAFGAGTADALFGAGSGNVLTKITKYATVVLLLLALVIGYLQDKAHQGGSSAAFERMVEQKQMQRTVSPAPGKQPAAPAQQQSAPAQQQPTPNNLPATAPAATSAPAK
jgi:preprotein translocase subunit SecG